MLNIELEKILDKEMRRMKEYSVSVPVNCMNLDEIGREKVLAKLKEFDAKRVFLNFEETLDSGGVYYSDNDIHLNQMNKLRLAADFFKSHDYEVAAWVWALMTDKNLDFTRLHDFNGNKVPSFACPTDGKFVEFAADCIEDIARCGVDMIVFNDDLRYGYFSNAMSCLCENHINLICQTVGEELTRDELKERIINGSENKYRDAYIKVNKDSFLNFASAMRKRVDAVNPSIRMGFCAVMSSWSIDGDAFELAAVLAGNNKPFIRLIGAPYWAAKKSWKCRLQDVIELNRMEKIYFAGKEIELIAEGDAWPRPRTNCPASLVEGYDTAIRATQQLDGILKIGLDYTASTDYDDGYAKFHVRNKPLYKRIESEFAGKKSVGVRVYEYAEKFKLMKNPNELGEIYNPEMLFFSEAARTLTCNGIPTVYNDTDGVGIVFGENARSLPLDDLKNGMIMDVAAAAILSERGVDVGIEWFGEKVTVLSETFIKSKNRIIAFNSPAYNIGLKESAEILSEGNTGTGNVPLSFVYQNSDDERFLIINTNPRENDILMRHYARGYQYRDFLGENFCATCTGNPDVYLLCSQGTGELVVGVWNFCIDPVITPVVDLGEEYKNIRFINGNGKICGKTVILDEIQAYGFAGFVVS